MPQSLPRLIEPDALAAHTDDRLLVHVGDPAGYAAGHIPGAILVSPSSLVDGRPPAPGRLPDTARLEALFAAIGYHPGQTIVVYDDEGGGWAGRFIWTLDVIGHAQWRYLDGGLTAWQGAGLPLETGPGKAPAPTKARIVVDAGPIAELEDVLAAIGDDAQLIWDVRSPEEYRGEKSGARRAGHVPGAVNLDWQRLKDPHRHLRLVENLRGVLLEHGIDGSRGVITHCQSHHRSGLSYLVARLLDFPNIRAYHGSWAEWGNREDTPVATGPAPQ